jgi:hypothetical protein
LKIEGAGQGPFNPLLSGRSLEKEVIVLQDRTSEHAIAHGRQVAVQVLSASKMDKSVSVTASKRKCGNFLQFIEGPDLSELEQTVSMFDITVTWLC